MVDNFLHTKLPARKTERLAGRHDALCAAKGADPATRHRRPDGSLHTSAHIGASAPAAVSSNCTVFSS